MRPWIAVGLFALGLGIGMTPQAWGQTAPVLIGPGCTVGWEMEASADLGGFRLYAAPTSKGYEGKPAAKTLTAAPITVLTHYTARCVDFGLTATGDYWMAVSAIDAIGNESEYSDELAVRLDATVPEAPTLALDQRLSQPASLMSSSPMASTHPASHMLDGCLADRPECTTGTDKAASIWVLLDLGQPAALTRARLFGDTVGSWHCVSWSLSLACAAEGPWTAVVTKRSCAGNAWFEEGLGLIGRYVRLEVYGNTAYTPGRTQARELEIYGVPGVWRCAGGAP